MEGAIAVIARGFRSLWLGNSAASARIHWHRRKPSSGAAAIQQLTVKRPSGVILSNTPTDYRQFAMRGAFNSRPTALRGEGPCVRLATWPTIFLGNRAHAAADGPCG